MRASNKLSKIMLMIMTGIRKKPILVLLVLICGLLNSNAHSQVIWNANCSNLNPPFKVSFTKNHASLILKGCEYELIFVGDYVGSKGDHFSVYQNHQLAIHTTYPLNNFLILMKPGNNASKISSGDCM